MLTVLKHELIHTYATREKALGEESDGVRKHNDQLVRKNRRLYNAYRNVVNQLEDVAPAGLKLHIQDEASMQSDEASELETEQMHQLFQMRQQLQLTEQELSASQQRNLNDAEEHRRTVASLGQRIDMLGEELHQARLSHEQQIQPARVVLEQIQSDLVTLLRAFGPGHMSEGILARLLSQLDALRVNFERSGARGTAASPVRSVRSGSRSASPSANAFAEARDREIDALRAEADAGSSRSGTTTTLRVPAHPQTHKFLPQHSRRLRLCASASLLRRIVGRRSPPARALHSKRRKRRSSRYARSSKNRRWQRKRSSSSEGLRCARARTRRRASSARTTCCSVSSTPFEGNWRIETASLTASVGNWTVNTASSTASVGNWTVNTASSTASVGNWTASTASSIRSASTWRPEASPSALR